MLRTFEGVIIKLLNDKKTQNIYSEFYYEFRDDIKSAEPPYMNLVYTANLLVNINKRLNKRKLFSPVLSWFYLMQKKVLFSIRSSSKRNWQLASEVFLSNDVL